MNSNNPVTRPGPDSSQDIEILKKRYDALSRQKTIAETNLANAQKNLDDLQRKARETYGTDDLAQLQAKLAQLQQENTSKRADYQQALDKIEQDLKTLEQSAQQPPTGQGR